MSGVRAVFYRELVMLWKKIGKLGYVFAALLYPLIYLFSFGLGMGGRQGLGDVYQRSVFYLGSSVDSQL